MIYLIFFFIRIALTIVSRIDCRRETGLREADRESIIMVQGKDSYSLGLGGISERSKKCEQSGDI